MRTFSIKDQTNSPTAGIFVAAKPQPQSDSSIRSYGLSVSADSALDGVTCTSKLF